MYGLQKEKGGFGLKFPLVYIKEKGFVELILRYDLGVIWSDFVVFLSSPMVGNLDFSLVS